MNRVDVQNRLVECGLTSGEVTTELALYDGLSPANQALYQDWMEQLSNADIVIQVRSGNPARTPPIYTHDQDNNPVDPSVATIHGKAFLISYDAATRPSGVAVVLWQTEAQPGSPQTDDLWLKPSTGDIKRWTGTVWNLISRLVTGALNFVTTTDATTRPAGTSVVMWVTNGAPSATPVTNDLWLSPTTNNFQRWTGSAWQPVNNGAYELDTVPANAKAGLGGPSGGDDAATIATAIATAVAAAISNGSYVAKVKFQPGIYQATRALQQGGTNKCNTQIPLPWIADTARTVTLILEGSAPADTAAGNGTAAGTTRDSGTIIQSTLTGQTFDATYGTPSIMGGPTSKQTALFTSLDVILDGIAFRAPDNPTLTACDLSQVSECEVRTFSADTTTNTPGVPTSPQAFGLILPANNNSAKAIVGNGRAFGYFGGLSFSECADVGEWKSYECRVGLVPNGPANHSAHIKTAFVSLCPYGIAYVDPSTGVSSIPTGTLPSSVFVFGIDNLSIEDSNAGGFVPVSHIVDANGAFRGRIYYNRVLAATGVQTGPLTLTGAANLRLIDRTVGGPRKASARHAAAISTAPAAAGALADLATDFDCVVGGSVGDWVLVSFTTRVPAGANPYYFDVKALGSGTMVGNSEAAGWSAIDSAAGAVSETVFYALQSSDIVAGQATFRAQFAADSTTPARGVTGSRLIVWNTGPLSN